MRHVCALNSFNIIILEEASNGAINDRIAHLRKLYIIESCPSCQAIQFKVFAVLNINRST